MDNLTHSLTGVAMSRAGLNRFSPHATLILVLSANAPDIDVVSLGGGSLTYLHYHRHITHALIFIPLLAFATALLVRLAAGKRMKILPAFGLAAAGIASHVLLDFTNTYGIRAYLPFSDRWRRLDITNVVDTWLWAVLILMVAAPALSKLVNSEIGARAKPGRGWAVFALSFLLAFEVLRYSMHGRALEVLESRIYRGAIPMRLAAFPHHSSPFRWTGVVEGENYFIFFKDFDVYGSFDPTAGQTYFKPEPSPVLDAARRTPEFQGFLKFSQFPFWRLTPLAEPEGATKVEAFDLRFGLPADPHFVATAIVRADRTVEKARFSYSPQP